MRITYKNGTVRAGDCDEAIALLATGHLAQVEAQDDAVMGLADLINDLAGGSTDED